MVEIKQVTGADITREMRKAGIWTPEDLRTKPQEAMGALVAAYGVTLGGIWEAVNQIEKELLEKD